MNAWKTIWKGCHENTKVICTDLWLKNLLANEWLMTKKDCSCNCLKCPKLPETFKPQID